MTLLETAAVAFAMFSALPVPKIEWNERNMRYAMAAFPLIGAVIGAVGTTAAAESGQPHLHFAVTKDGKAVDPNEYLSG